MKSSYNDLIAFHGHSCPGLAIGYRMINAALDGLSKEKAKDEELVAIVENNACGVDAVQYISGCTFGKGNLIFRDYGKPVYTLYNRHSKKGIRVVFRDENVPKDPHMDRNHFIKWLLNAPEGEIVSKRDVQIDEPESARIFKSIKCAFCGESVMDTRVRTLKGKPACIPCAENQENSENPFKENVGLRTRQ